MAIKAIIQQGKGLIGDSVFVSFPFNMNYINFIKNLRERKWHVKTKQWEIPMDAFELFKKYAKDPVEIVDLRKKEMASTLPQVEIPSDYTFNFKPYKHQMETIKFGLNHPRFLMALEMGLGKSVSSAVLADILHKTKGYKHCLIICGIGSTRYNWRAEIKKFLNQDAYILGTRTNYRGEEVPGAPADRALDLNKIDELPYFIITQKETLRNEDAAKKLKDLCNFGKISCIIYDEVHKGLNFQTLQGKAIKALQTETMMALTGTPIVNSPEDAYNVLHWLGYVPQSKTAFLNHYAIKGGYMNYQIVGWKNLPDLKAKLDPMQIRFTKEECLDLPKKIYKEEYLYMEDEQAKLYNEVRNTIMENVDKVKLSPNPLSELIRLRQVTSTPKILSSTINESVKFDRALDIIEGTIAHGNKVVVYSNWVKTLEHFIPLIQKYNPAIVTGETKNVPFELNKFNTNPNCKIIVGTITALGTGHNLQVANNVIFLDEPYTMAARLQAEDRCHRIGQNSSVTISILMCKNTVDERIHELIEEKQHYSDLLIDGNIEKINKDKLVDFLLS